VQCADKQTTLVKKLAETSARTGHGACSSSSVSSAATAAAVFLAHCVESHEFLNHLVLANVKLHGILAQPVEICKVQPQ
jgi:hypothetical protein